MAKSKLEVESGFDIYADGNGTEILTFRRKSGAITEDEVIEWCKKNYYSGNWLVRVLKVSDDSGYVGWSDEDEDTVVEYYVFDGVRCPLCRADLWKEING